MAKTLEHSIDTQPVCFFEHAESLLSKLFWLNNAIKQDAMVDVLLDEHDSARKAQPALLDVLISDIRVQKRIHSGMLLNLDLMGQLNTLSTRV